MIHYRSNFRKKKEVTHKMRKTRIGLVLVLASLILVIVPKFRPPTMENSSTSDNSHDQDVPILSVDTSPLQSPQNGKNMSKNATLVNCA